MQTEDAKVVNDAQRVFVNLPLTKPTGKIHVAVHFRQKSVENDVLEIIKTFFKL